MEESLDALNAEIATQNLVKKVLEQKLEQVCIFQLCN